MSESDLMSGVLSPVITLFDENLDPDGDKLIDADTRQANLDQVRSIFQGYVMIPAMKAAVAHYSHTPSWRNVRPPLDAFDESQSLELIKSLEAIGFTMDGLERRND